MTERALGEFVELQRGNTYKSALLGLPGPTLLGLGSIQRNGGFRGENLKTYGGETDPRMLLVPGDVYVSLKDVTQSADLLGAVARVPREVELGRLTQDTVKLTFKNGALANLIFWVLRSPQYRSFCRSYATGTTNLGLPREDFLAYPIPNPTPARLQLVTVLDALDEKIELNLRMNETLEAMSQTIFKDWFVYFGPTRAKIEGRASYLPSEIWSLFPSALNAEGMPEGWSTKRVDDILELVYGKALRAADRVDGPTPVYGSGGIIGYHDKALVEGPSVIVGRKGTVGALYWEDRPFFPIDTVFYVKPKAPLTFCYYHLQTLGLAAMNTDAAVPGLNRNNVCRLAVPWSTSEVRYQFDQLIGPLRRRQRANTEEIEALTALRDLLLSRLVSGEIRVSDAASIY